MKIGKAKTDNNHHAVGAKIEIRRMVMSGVPSPRVFDAFCGSGKMFDAVWHEACEYVGCDERPWNMDDPPRFVADNRLILRTLPLDRFNIFDFDAYGSPWEQVLILASRRVFVPMETIGLVLTDGTSLKSRFGGIPRAVQVLAGLKSLKKNPSDLGTKAIAEMALRGFLKKTGLHVISAWQADGVGSSKMVYSGFVLQSRGE